MTAAKYLTPLQAARGELGWEGNDRAVDKRFKHAVFKKEQRLGRQIFIRWGSKGSGVRYRITRPLMRKYLAELYDDTDRAIQVVREQANKLAKSYADMRAELYGRQDALAESHDRISAGLDALEKRLDVLSGSLAGRQSKQHVTYPSPTRIP